MFISPWKSYCLTSLVVNDYGVVSLEYVSFILVEVLISNFRVSQRIKIS